MVELEYLQKGGHAGFIIRNSWKNYGWIETRILEFYKKQFENLETNPQELLILEDRMNEINGLLNKHKLKYSSELILLREDLRKKSLKRANDLPDYKAVTNKFYQLTKSVLNE